MTDKKKAKTAEIEGLVVKIGVDVETAAIASATAALKELAEAANLAREALDRLCGVEPIVVNVAVPSGAGGGGGDCHLPTKKMTVGY